MALQDDDLLNLTIFKNAAIEFPLIFFKKALLCRDHSKICKGLHSHRIKFSKPTFSKTIC